MEPNLLNGLVLTLVFAWPLDTRSFGNAPFENKYTSVGAIPLPPGFRRIAETEKSFGSWLRNLPLKKDKCIFLYNGQLKSNQDMQFAVIDLPLAKKTFNNVQMWS
jgi:hypothetical protein